MLNFGIVGGIKNIAPSLSSVYQYGNGTGIECIIYGPGTFVIGVERETGVGTGVFTEIGTFSASVPGASRVFPRDFNGITSNPSTTIDGFLNFKYRIRVKSPIASNYSVERQLLDSYFPDPTASALSISINGGRTQISLAYTGGGTAYTWSLLLTGPPNEGSSNFGLPPAIYNVVNQPLVNPCGYIFSMQISTGFWFISKSGNL